MTALWIYAQPISVPRDPVSISLLNKREENNLEEEREKTAVYLLEQTAHFPSLSKGHFE